MAKDKQTKLNIQADKKMDTVDTYEFEPIKGYPMLHWKGKRPFNSTQFFPAQLKETYGDTTDGWLNKIFWGDNLQVMSHLLKEYRGKVDLIYIDPPFDSKADYKKKIKLKGKQVTNDQNSFEEKQYTDIWSNDEYLQFMYERLIMLRELLSENGSIYLHCDWHKSHFLRCILDEIFGSKNFKSEIIWRRSSSTGSSKALSTKFPTNHDTIFFYSKSDFYTYTRQFKPYEKEYLKRFRYDDDDGRGKYRLSDLNTFSQATFDRLKDDNRLVEPKKKGSNYSYKRYLTETKGVVIDDVWCDELDDIWLDINFVNPMANEGTAYPTQKPESLIERIIEASSNPCDLIFDCFMGSGTTQAVAMKLGRRFIGADINLGAVETTTKRLINIQEEIKANPPELTFPDEEGEDQKVEKFYTGFSVYNVNNYDVFRNPVEAKDLLLKALEIQPLKKNIVFDGEKDGRMVKIMPVDRIATRADLNELVSNLNYKALEKKSDKNPGKAVESILLVCMGHEPDLAASLQKEVPYKLDIEVVDILRDKSNLEFKRDAEANIIVSEGKLEIEAFYPMNLLQKLSIMKENVENWKELTESVKIDWNYDGAVFEPKEVDIPDKDELVRGTYEIPEDAGTIKVKITDLLSESFETEISHG